MHNKLNALALTIGILLVASTVHFDALSFVNSVPVADENQLASVIVTNTDIVRDISVETFDDNAPELQALLAPTAGTTATTSEVASEMPVPVVEEKKIIVPEEKKKPVQLCPQENTLGLDAFLFPMSKTFSVDEAYVPDQLVQVPSTYVKNKGFVCVTEEALGALTLMFDDAKEEGYTLYVTSGFRTYETQESLFEYYTDVLGLADAERRSAHPGHSEHQLGTAMDITGGTSGSTSHSFGDTPEGVWAAENAVDYGFVLSYPHGKEHITGYMYEPWHFRYVGQDAAEDVAEQDVTLLEYLRALYDELMKS
jgi:LAS superfamily LD-carboxypeptidase LdcB